MNILVCLKQILDPEMPAREFRIDEVGSDVDLRGAGLVMNIFCANALETALQFREQHGGKITVLAFGTATTEEILRKALALKVDAAVLVKHEFAARPNPWLVARSLAGAIRKLGGFDLVLTGRESGDWGDGQTGGLLAEELGLPCVSFADQLSTSPSTAGRPTAGRPTSGRLVIRRQTDQGTETVDASVPLVVTVTNNEHNVPRIAKTRDVMQAFRLPLTTLSIADIGLNESDIDGALRRTGVNSLVIPSKQAHCEMVIGDTLDDRITNLAKKIIAVVQS